MAKKQTYPSWKKIVWRFTRVFVGVSFVTLGTSLPVAQIDSFEEVLPKLIIPALSAGLVALGKAVREYVASDDYENLIHKLVV